MRDGWPETEVDLDNSSQEISYAVKSIMLTQASIVRSGDPATAPWGPAQLLENRVAVTINAQPSHRRVASTGHHHLAVLPVTAEYRLREARDDVLLVPQEPEMDDEPLLRIKVEYSGIFEIAAESDRLNEFLRTTAPTVLFPYVSMTISDLLAKVGCQPLLLPPIDFAALKRQAIAEAVTDATATRQ